jgi:hypothetical protein
MSADEGTLGALHNKVAEVLSVALDGQQLPDYIDPETEELVKGTKLQPQAATITAAIQFLKNNNITCAPSENNAIGELERKMKARQDKRANRAGANVVDFEEARETATFLGNRINGA